MAAPFDRVDDLGTLADGRHVVRLLCEALPVADARAEIDTAAKWIQICPAGPLVKSRDNRMFQVDDLTKVANASELPVLLDWEHRSEWGGETRAAGWFEEFAVEDGAEPKRFPRAGLWGRVDLTPDGAKDVEGKSYRFVSPVLILDGETRQVLSVVSVALTNRPALHMADIGAYRERLSVRVGPFREGEQKMDPKNRKLLLSALALKDDATDEQVIAAAQTRPQPQDTAGAEERAALSRQNTELSVKVTELTAQLATKDTAIEVLKANLAKTTEDAEKAAFATEVKTLLDANVKKIAPAARAGYEAFCLESRANFESFQKNVLAHLPEIGNPAPKSKPQNERVAHAVSGLSELTKEARAALKANGLTDEQIDKAQAYRAEQRAEAGLVTTNEED